MGLVISHCLLQNIGDLFFSSHVNITRCCSQDGEMKEVAGAIDSKSMRPSLAVVYGNPTMVRWFDTVLHNV